jgi:hypothetical protein
MENSINNRQVELLIEMLEDRIFMLEDVMKVDGTNYVADIVELESLKTLFKLALES